MQNPVAVIEESASRSGRPRTLSKSDFKLARTCEAKLYFRENGYPDARKDDPFLKMLAEGGYMVEALAKAHHPEGRELSYGGDFEQDWHATREALQAENVTLFEATLLHERCMARVDILEKRGNCVRLLEVKAASIDFRDHVASLDVGGPGAFRSTRDPSKIVAKYESYLEDVTYQTVLFESLFPDLEVQPYLVLVDKSATSQIDRLHDLFEVLPARESRDVRAPRFLGSASDLSRVPLLAEVDVSFEVSLLRESVAAAARQFALKLDAPRDQFEAVHDAHCRDCEFRTADGARDGFRECWGELADVRPHMLDMFSIGTLKAVDGSPLVPALRSAGTVSLFDIPDSALQKKDGTVGPTNERQRRQIAHTQSGVPFVAPTLAATFETLRYPLHFIDFEASRVALPYHAGMSPYGLLAFQWSCHTVATPGAAPVHTEWLNTSEPWPCGAFVDSLRACVGDEGSILVWSSFENSTLRDLRSQLEQRRQLTPDVATWLDGLGPRIVDLMNVAKRDYYHPLMGGRVSIKVVLDALWQTDPLLREQCAEWSTLGLNAERDPYKALPPIEINGEAQEVHDGTGAIRAYEMMLFTDATSDSEQRERWSRLLRQYCELDTLSMVLVFEHWRRLVQA